MRKPGAVVFDLVGTAVHAGLYSLIPFSFARGDRRSGWRDGRPGPINRIGAIPILLGAGFISWAVHGHHRAAPDAPLTLKPEHLAEHGAYSVSRNPLYVGGMTMWFGWAVLLGSRRAGAIGVGWLAGLAGAGVPFEERMLDATFGESYRSYCGRVPRWL